MPGLLCLLGCSTAGSAADVEGPCLPPMFAGTSKVPLGGFKDLQGVHGPQKFQVHKAYGPDERLPSGAARQGACCWLRLRFRQAHVGPRGRAGRAAPAVWQAS
jgi:hypothetical protein